MLLQKDEPQLKKRPNKSEGEEFEPTFQLVDEQILANPTESLYTTNNVAVRCFSVS